MSEEKPKKEIISQNLIEKKDPKYIYYFDKDGNACRKLRTYTKRKQPKPITNYFNEINLTLPKVIVNGFVSTKFKKVTKTGPNGGMIWLPATLVGREFKVILIPKEDWIVGQINN